MIKDGWYKAEVHKVKNHRNGRKTIEFIVEGKIIRMKNIDESKFAELQKKLGKNDIEGTLCYVKLETRTFTKGSFQIVYHVITDISKEEPNTEENKELDLLTEYLYSNFGLIRKDFIF